MSELDVVWYRGVPWIRAALTRATADDVVDAMTEVAREFRDTIQYDPGRVLPSEVAWVERSGHTVGVNRDLVVVGHERPEKASLTASGAEPGPEAEDQTEPRPKGRGPVSYSELEEWLGDEGYAVVKSASGHLAVVDHEGVRRVTMSFTPSDKKRALRNDTAVCRRVLGIPLRRTK